MPAWAYFVRDCFSFSAADSHSRRSVIGPLGEPEVQLELIGVRPRRIRPSSSASMTPSEPSGTGTETPVALLMA